MATKLCKLCIASYLPIFWVLTAYGTQQPEYKRRLKTEIRCASEKYINMINGSYPNVVYSEAVGHNDTLHYVLSTIGAPTILVARTHLKSEIEINCQELLSGTAEGVKGAIKFQTEPLYSQILMFNRLLEYNDTNDDADLMKISPDPHLWHVYNLQDLPWKNCSEVSDLSQHSVTFMVDSDTGDLNFYENGSVSLQFQMFDHEGRTEELPHLQFTANTSQFSLILNQINTTFTASRFALEMTVMTSDQHNASIVKNVSRFLDDEHTPGQFEMIDWTFGKGAFLQWKPVSYFKSDFSFKTATRAKDYPLHNTSLTELEHEPSIAYAFYGDSLFSQTLATKTTNVSFGLTEDKFYVLHHYTAWTASMGYGKPPMDTVSSLIIIVICVGLGLPVVIIIFGGVGICTKKKKVPTATLR